MAVLVGAEYYALFVMTKIKFTQGSIIQLIILCNL